MSKIEADLLARVEQLKQTRDKLRGALSHIYNYGDYDWADPKTVEAAFIHFKEVARTAFNAT